MVLNKINFISLLSWVFLIFLGYNESIKPIQRIFLVKKNFLLWLGGITVLSIILVVTLRQFRASENETILLGASLPLSGINSHLGKDVVVGANTYFSHTNAKGGVHGKKIEFIQYDDKYEPENTPVTRRSAIRSRSVFFLVACT